MKGRIPAELPMKPNTRSAPSIATLKTFIESEFVMGIAQTLNSLREPPDYQSTWLTNMSASLKKMKSQLQRQLDRQFCLNSGALNRCVRGQRAPEARRKIARGERSEPRGIIERTRSPGRATEQMIFKKANGIGRDARAPSLLPAKEGVSRC